ncbi:MAG: hypothetical protein AAGC92_12835 [Pseudomonadota bacterium]
MSTPIRDTEPPIRGAIPPPRLRVDLFGGVRASVGGVPVEIPSTKARALLASMVLGGTGEETRAVLAERLWSRRDSSEHQRNSLKRDLKTLLDLFRPLGFDGLVGRRQTVQLDLSRTDCDVFETQRSAERGLAHRVLLTQERPFERLAMGCDDVDPAFSAWLVERARILSDSVSRALDLALSAAEDDPHRRMDLARAAFNLDRTKQSAAMVLMQTLEDLDDVSGALRVYSTLYIAHLQEHDEPPSGRIVEKVEALKLGQQARATGRETGDREDGAPKLPARLGIDAGEAISDPGLRSTAFGMIDALGRRPGQIAIIRSGLADWRLQIVSGGQSGESQISGGQISGGQISSGQISGGQISGGQKDAYLQLWHVETDRLAWSEPVAQPQQERIEAAAARIASVILRNPTAVDTSPAAPDVTGAAETFALKLLLSRPDAPVRMPDEAPRPDPQNPVLQVDLGWRALLHGQRRDALAALRSAIGFAGGHAEVLGAAALGLALLGEPLEAVKHADRLADRPQDAGLRALRGTTLAICGDRRLASVCLADLPEGWLLPRMLGAAMSDLIGDRTAALRALGPSLDDLGDSAGGFCDWAMRTLPLPEAAEPMLLRERLMALVLACPDRTPA